MSERDGGDPRSSIEAFAELAARLSHRRIDRTAILLEAALGEDEWKAIVLAWHDRFEGLKGEALEQRFAITFERVKREQRRAFDGESL